MFITKCPRCNADDRLTVISGVFITTGMCLTEDGFAFSEAKSVNTEDENVQCSACQYMFDLSDLHREDPPTPPDNHVKLKGK